MNTPLLLMAQYGGKAIIPIEDVCRDYFPHLKPLKLVQKDIRRSNCDPACAH